MKEAPRRRRFLVAYGAWVFVILAYFVPGATWNPVSRFDLTRSIVERRTLAIDGFEDSTGDHAFRDGHWYTDKAPVPSLLAVPPYAIFHVALRAFGGEVQYEPVEPESASRIRVNRSFQVGLYVCSVGTAALAGAALALLLFETLRARASPGAALAGSIAVVLTTPVLPYSTSFYGHVIAALFLFLAFTLLDRRPASKGAVRLAGACLVLAVGCEYLSAIPGAVVAAAYLWSRGRTGARHAVRDLAAGAALPALILATYSTLAFGAPWRSGYSYLVRPSFVHGHEGGFLGVHMPRLVAMVGLLVGPRRGLFLVAPATLVALAALVHRAFKVVDRTNRVALAALAAMYLANSGYYMWWGGAAAGPRHLVPVLPLLGYGFAAAWNAPRARLVLALLGLVSFASMVALTAVGLEAPERGNVLLDYLLPNIARGRVAITPGSSNLGLCLGLRGALSLAPLLAWTTAGLAWLSREAMRWPADD